MTTISREQHLLRTPKWWQLLKEGQHFTRAPRKNAVLEATVLAISDRDVWVDLDGKRDGLVPRQDLETVDAEYVAQLKVGDQIPVWVVKVPWNRSGIVVSLKQGLEQQDWIRAQHLLDTQDIITVNVVDTNRGGVLVAFGRLRGFIPNSHLVAIPRTLDFRARQERKPALVGTTLEVMVIEVNPQRRRLILSERQAQKARSAQLMDALHEGEIRVGTVANLTNFGAFVDLGGVNGLLHISEISWDHVGHPREVLEIGEEVTVYVLDVDRKRQRIGLSQKRLLSPPRYATAS